MRPPNLVLAYCHFLNYSLLLVDAFPIQGAGNHAHVDLCLNHLLKFILNRIRHQNSFL